MKQIIHKPAVVIITRVIAPEGRERERNGRASDRQIKRRDQSRFAREIARVKASSKRPQGAVTTVLQWRSKHAKCAHVPKNAHIFKNLRQNSRSAPKYSES